MNDSRETSVLVVNGDSDARERIAAGLSRDRYKVVPLADSEAGLSNLQRLQPELIVLLLQESHGDDERLIRRFREATTSPIIVLADGRDWRWHARNLHQGADQVLSASVSVRELRSRIRALLWRAGAPHPPVPQRWQVAVQGEVDIATATD